jgi:hypothetical protein
MVFSLIFLSIPSSPPHTRYPTSGKGVGLSQPNIKNDNINKTNNRLGFFYYTFFTS